MVPVFFPYETLFPGPWERFIKAPANKTHITPTGIWAVEGNVTTSAHGGPLQVGEHVPGSSILIGPGGLLTLEFAENIAGRVCFDVESVGGDPELDISHSESPLFADGEPDATTDRLDRDLPLNLEFGNRTGTVCVGTDFVRGGFKYLTLQMPDYPVWRRDQADAQQVLGGDRDPYKDHWVSITDVWVICTAFPSQTNGRAYSGYFYSSNNMLNRIWYAGAYTLQLSTIDPREGSALIDYNRLIDHNKSPTGSWYSNFTIAHGKAVTTDGAKRDRMVWPGDMFIAVPAIAMSTYDMAAVRNALDVLFEHQYSDGSLPYAGPPMGFRGEFSDTYHMHTLLGVYNYVLFSGDLAWLRRRWPAYLEALGISIAKVDQTGLLHVTSAADWLRPGMGGHNLEASAMLSALLERSAMLARWLGEDDVDNGAWIKTREALHAGIQSLYCPSTGLYSDNLGSRSCSGSEHVDPQDGNSWVLIAGAASPSRAANVSEALRARWLRHGAPATEFPNVISPFASSFELLAHAAAEVPNSTLELILLEWSHLLDGHGFTNSTLAEGFRIDGDPQYPAYASSARNSHCHGWSAGPTSAVVSDAVLGIKLLAPAGARWVVRPRLTRWLAWARGGFATAKGLFEVRASRVMAVDERDGRVLRPRGIMVEVSAPADTEGALVLDLDGVEQTIDLRGGKIVAYVVWESQQDSERTPEETRAEIDLETRKAAANEEEWYLQTMSGGPGVSIIFDDTFEAPEMEERPIGVVDWEAMERNYHVSSARTSIWLGEGHGSGGREADRLQ
ncbi:Six-hairpin glycosidase-like protein [Plectosphaerella plurivora]|uniref:Six-hairpin glycosidase-like protein n=1 Tax=Plectosphaerella plurivora TaxID=936078 RepID=A0A9P8V8N2_9PEZI|nr:Six-hairpin glycosidase-like protein [Plectosphaerella plurivora]